MSKTATRVLQVRLIVSTTAPYLSIPEAHDYPLIAEAREYLIGVLEHVHIVRMDTAQLSQGEVERLRSSGWPPRARQKIDWWLVGVWASYMALIGGGFTALALLLAQCAN